MTLGTYECFTTFWNDFTIAETFGGIPAIRDTCKRAMAEWKTDYKYLTELVMVLNHKIWQWYGIDESVAKCYDALWRKAEDYALDNLKGDELDYYWRTTD